MAQGGSNKKVANSLVATAAAAVFAVYAAGYSRTRSAADLFDAQSAERRQPVSDSARPAVPVAPAAVGAKASVAVAEPAHDTPVTSAKDVATAASAAPEPDKPEPVEHASLAPAPSMTQTAESPTSGASAMSAPPVVAPAPVAVAPVASLATPAPAAAQPSVAALAPVAAPAAPAAAAAAKWKDGTYTGWGTCRHGDIQAQVIIQSGRILSANIAQCLTRYSCSVIAALPPEVAKRQSPEVDYVSGATQSANAFFYAVVDALSKAK